MTAQETGKPPLAQDSKPGRGETRDIQATVRPEWPKSAVRVAFGLIWAVDAAFKWRASFRAGYLGGLTDAAKGQPGWLDGWFNFWIDLQRPRVDFFAYLVAVVETLIAVALIFGFARKITYICGAVFSLLIWSTAEGFGGPYTAGSTDVGTALVYALMFLALLAISAQVGTSRYSVDAIIERHVPWWYRIAEVTPRQALISTHNS
jgi:nitrite reductase (NO-forming)